MYPEAFSALLVSPVALGVLVLAVGISTLLSKAIIPNSSSKVLIRDLGLGYACAIVLMMFVGLLVDASSNDGSKTAIIFLPFVATTIMALFGVPLIAILVRMDRFNFLGTFVASIAISGVLVVADLSVGANGASSVAGMLGYSLLIIGFTVVTMLVFALGARILRRTKYSGSEEPFR